MKHTFSLKTVVSSFITPHPLRDWLMAVAVSAIVLIILAGISLYFFFGVRSGALMNEEASPTVSIPRVNKESLSQVVQGLLYRKNQFELNQISTPTFADPSK